MKLTLYTTDETSTQLLSCDCSHITMFKDNELEIHFITEDSQLIFMQKLIDNYVLFQVQGNHIKLIPEGKNFQRLAYRFD